MNLKVCSRVILFYYINIIFSEINYSCHFSGLKDAYIIYLNAYESIDATKKGSLARFINHSW